MNVRNALIKRILLFSNLSLSLYFLIREYFKQKRSYLRKEVVFLKKKKKNKDRASICGPVFKIQKGKILKYPDIVAGSFMQD